MPELNLSYRAHDKIRLIVIKKLNSIRDLFWQTEAPKLSNLTIFDHNQDNQEADLNTPYSIHVVV